LLLTWVALSIAVRFAPKAVAAVAIASMVAWLGSAVVAAMGIHRLLWRNPASTVPAWAKGVSSFVAVLVWLGLLGKVLQIVFPTYFRMPVRRQENMNQRSFAERLGQDPELTAFVHTLRSSGQGDSVEQIVANKTASGFGRLDVPTRRRRMQLLREIFGAAGDETCAAMAGGSARPEDVQAAVQRLPSEQQEAWNEVLVAALKAELRQTPPPPSPSEAEIARVRAALSAQTLGDPQLQSVRPDAGAAYGRKLCRVVLDTYRIILQMPDELQSAALRMELQFQ
jgi:hypothetical protein